MKIALCSDVHLEFGQLKLENTEGAEVLILSGDICTATDLRPTGIVGSAKWDRYMDFFKNCSMQFPHVVYVAGNHEHYHGDYADSLSIIKEALSHLTNIHILDKEVWDHEGYRFIGGTLWTDMNGECEQTMQHVLRRMNDFQICENSTTMVSYKSFDHVFDENGQKKLNPDGTPIFKASFHKRPGALSPQDVVIDHKAMLKVIEDTYTATPPDMPIIIAGHHAPSKLSTHPRYKQDVLMNGAYSSDLNQFILDRPGIKLWTHGHTHEDFDYMLGTARIVCNPRGYINYEDRADNFQLKFIEV